MAEKATKMVKAPASPERKPGRSALARFRGGSLAALEREFDEFRRRLHWPAFLSGERHLLPLGQHGRYPAFDVFEQGDEVIAKAELPGMTKDDIEIRLTDSTLTVKGEKRCEEERKEDDYTYSERSFGSISRTVELPVEVKAEGAKATFKDGVLEIRMAKTDEAKHRATKVPIQ